MSIIENITMTQVRSTWNRTRTRRIYEARTGPMFGWFRIPATTYARVVRRGAEIVSEAATS